MSNTAVAEVKRAHDMPAGLAMNRRVALEFMGWQEWKHEEGDWEGDDRATYFADFGDGSALAVYVASDEPTFYFDPSNSKDIASAWMIVEKMRLPSVSLGTFWRCWHWVAGVGSVGGNGETAQLAICRAALHGLELQRDAATEAA